MDLSNLRVETAIGLIAVLILAALLFIVRARRRRREGARSVRFVFRERDDGSAAEETN